MSERALVESGTTEYERRRQLNADLHAAQASVSSGQVHLLSVIAECDRAETWRDDGCRNTAEWLSAELGISNWAAHRWIAAGHALPLLPHSVGPLRPASSVSKRS